jgi:hypothetical protein
MSLASCGMTGPSRPAFKDAIMSKLNQQSVDEARRDMRTLSLGEVKAKRIERAGDKPYIAALAAAEREVIAAVQAETAGQRRKSQLPMDRLARVVKPGAESGHDDEAFARSLVYLTKHTGLQPQNALDLTPDLIQTYAEMAMEQTTPDGPDLSILSKAVRRDYTAYTRTLESGLVDPAAKPEAVWGFLNDRRDDGEDFPSRDAFLRNIRRAKLELFGPQRRR